MKTLNDAYESDVFGDLLVSTSHIGFDKLGLEGIGHGF